MDQACRYFTISRALGWIFDWSVEWCATVPVKVEIWRALSLVRTLGCIQQHASLVFGRPRYHV
eukprot:2091380-Pyramimonas_sp.AAC.1